MTVPEPDADILSTGPFGLRYVEGGLVNAIEAEDFDLEQVSRDVDGLLMLGYLTDDFVLYGHHFTIRTLRRGEKLAVGELIQQYADTIGVGDAISAVTVAACLVLVDNRPLASPLGAGEEEDPAVWIRRAYSIVKKWYDPVIDSVWDKYNALLVRQGRAFLEFEGKR